MTFGDNAPEVDPRQLEPDLEHRYADVNGVRLHYVIGGTGPAVVLLHGWPFTWMAWRRTMPTLAAHGYTVIAPDLRGMGDSTKPDSGYSKANVAEDIHQLVAELGFDDIDLVGMDIGTMVAYAYASEHPDVVRHLVLAESALPGFGLEALMDPAKGGSFHFGFHAQVDLATFLTAGRERTYLTRFLTLMAPNGLEDIEEFLLAYQAPEAMRGGFEHYATMVEDGKANRKAAAERPGLPMPVLVLNGQHGLPQAVLLDGVLQLAVDVQHDVVPDSAHVIGADNPIWLSDRLNRFFTAESAA